MATSLGGLTRHSTKACRNSGYTSLPLLSSENSIPQKVTFHEWINWFTGDFLSSLQSLSG